MSSPLFKVILGALCISFAPILAKAITLPADTLAFYRLLFGTSVFYLLSFRSKKESIKLESFKTKSGQLLLLFAGIAGIFFALDMAIWHRSIFMSGAGMATILTNTQVFYVALIGLIFFKEKLTLRFWLALPLAFSGVFLLVHFKNENYVGEDYNLGVLFGLLAGLAYSIYLIFLKRVEALFQNVSLLQKLTLVFVFTTFVLFLLSTLGDNLSFPDTRNLILLIVLAVVAQVAGWYFITQNLSHVPIAHAGLALLIQPVFASLMGMVFYQEYLSSLQVFGAVLTLIGIYLGTTRRKVNLRNKKSLRLETKKSSSPNLQKQEITKDHCS